MNPEGARGIRAKRERDASIARLARVSSERGTFDGERKRERER